MNIGTFFRQYEIHENPFAAEEARYDAVFPRVEDICHHPDYLKVRGDFARPSSAIVFGERGSGKTAIRLQIEDDLREHNRDHPQSRCLGVSYDELNPVLDRFHQQMRLKPADETLAQFRLADHIDGILSTIVPSIVDQALGEHHATGAEPALDVDGSLAKRLRALEPSAKRDLMLLQVCYDRPEEADLRTRRLRHAMRAPGGWSVMPWLKWSAAILGVFTLAMVGYILVAEPQEQRWLWLTGTAVLAIITLGLGGRWLWLWSKTARLARDLAKSLRSLHRSPMSFRKSLTGVRVHDLFAGELPRLFGEDSRYEMMKRLQRAIAPLGYRSILVLFDRVDEPTLINGEPTRMRAVVWPMLNNKFLQLDGFGVKMLLPLDLKHLLFRESQEFFREARLDKQNLIDRLVWSGAMLYDVCTARLNACRPKEADPISLSDLFEENVSRQDLVDALDQMQQPRDAFKMLYRVIQEHCANVPEEQPAYKVPKLTLDSVRRDQVERLSGMLRGVRPA